MSERKLITGKTETELNESIVLKIKTKCPGKWLIIDQETGEMYKGLPNKDGSQWLKL